MIVPFVDPEILQSRFGVNFLFWSGEFSENCPQISQRVRQRISPFFGLVSPGFRPPPPKKKNFHA